MAKLKISNAEIQEILSGKEYNFPKYTTQIMNLANSNAQGTRPKVVGQMSDLIQECPANKLEEWEEWYLKKHPNALENATEKVLAMVNNLKEVIFQIDEEMVAEWVKELVIVKTFTGLKFQEAILKTVASEKNTTYRLAKPHEESQGIDGLIGTVAVSIKPITYKVKNLNENIEVPIIFYEKKSTGITVEYDF
ncbi:MjaI family restriction endonuclease [Myroides phaeus]|uniref:MjaI family restriction endonuclease n=1 Tax=Myroides phaeus TaxID=702745 RepID=UPI00130318C0|nr:MjaI family restriction endonuclease [Myroides phaeus]